MNRISELRKRNGLKQSELSSQLGVVQATLSYWENEKFDIDNRSLQKLAEIFDVSTDYILGRTNDPTPPGKEKAPISDEDLKFALWGNPDIDDEKLKTIRKFAKMLEDEDDEDTN